MTATRIRMAGVIESAEPCARFKVVARAGCLRREVLAIRATRMREPLEAGDRVLVVVDLTAPDRGRIVKRVSVGD